MENYNSKFYIFLELEKRPVIAISPILQPPAQNRSMCLLTPLIENQYGKDVQAIYITLQFNNWYTISRNNLVNYDFSFYCSYDD